MTTSDLISVPSPVLRVDHFRQARLVYSCQAPKRKIREYRPNDDLTPLIPRESLRTPDVMEIEVGP